MSVATAKTRRGARIAVSPGTKGAISEHLATAWLLAKGYDVFRNVSPNGRADLLAVDWTADKTIRVDVKSEGFTLEPGRGGGMGVTARKRAEANSIFDIRYLIVKSDGDCRWYDEPADTAANDNCNGKWTDKLTGKSFWKPGHAMTNKEWTYFCYWLIRNHPSLVISETFIRNISALGIANDRPVISPLEIEHLERQRVKVYEALAGEGK